MAARRATRADARRRVRSEDVGPRVVDETLRDGLQSASASDPPVDEPLVPLTLRVNGERVDVAVRPSRTLLELLRKDLDLVGTKQGCDEGDCGACTVLLDGAPVLACLTLALSCRGREVVTVESLAGAPALDPLLDAFDRCGAGQCGFCTSGMLLTGKALLRANAHPTRYEIREAISGNLCRCTGYGAIVDAIDLAASGDASGRAPPLPGVENVPPPLPPYPERRR
jgi:carbon-monoxide dehydrogenase small subunit